MFVESFEELNFEDESQQQLQFDKDETLRLYSRNVAEYLNYVVGKLKLDRCIHSDIRQVYISKLSNGEIPTLDDCRPISITSPIIKMAEILLKQRMENNVTITKINSNQTGFTRGCDTGINLLRVLTDVKMLKK